MTKKQLQEKVLSVMNKAIKGGDKKKDLTHIDEYSEMLGLIDKWIQEVIGESDDKLGRFSPTDWYDIRNQLRAEQRKKAGV